MNYLDPGRNNVLDLPRHLFVPKIVRLGHLHVIVLHRQLNEASTICSRQRRFSTSYTLVLSVSQLQS